MNLGDIEADIYDTLNLGLNPDSAVVRRIRRYINDVQREVLTKKNIGPKVRKVLLTFNTQSTSPFCVVPQALVRIFVVTDRTNNNLLDPMDLRTLRWNDPGLKSSSAIPYAYDIYNMSSPVAVDPTAATSLTAVSDSATDGTGSAVNVEGITSDGQYFKTSVSLNGLSAVAVGSIATWLTITKFFLSSPAAGHVSLKDGSGNTLAQISPGRSYARYTRLHMYPNTTSVLTLSVDGELRIEDMSNSADEPYLPEDFHDIFVSGALSKEYVKRSKIQESAYQQGVKNKRVSELQAWITKPTGVAWTQERNRRFSQLGPWFPAGS